MFPLKKQILGRNSGKPRVVSVFLDNNILEKFLTKRNPIWPSFCLNSQFLSWVGWSGNMIGRNWSDQCWFGSEPKPEKMGFGTSSPKAPWFGTKLEEYV